MSLATNRRAAAVAEQRLRGAHDVWRVRVRDLRRRIAPHETAWIIGAGLTSGLIAGLSSARSGVRVLTRTFGLLLRSPISTALIGAIVRRDSDTDSATP